MPRKIDDYGTVTYDGNDAVELLYAGIDIRRIVEADDIVAEYNQSCLKFDKRIALIEQQTTPDISPRQFHARNAQDWRIPEHLKSVDVRVLLLSKCSTDDQRDRVEKELEMFEQRQLIPMLRMVVAIVEHFRRNNVVWGVGRGSSVASYCLFLLGLHKIDSFKYDLDIGEFLR